jgi:hypothetical protein
MAADPKHHKASGVLWAILLLGFAARLWWVLAVDTQPVTDFAWYFNKATEISQGLGYQDKGFSTAYWPVGWPAALGLMFKLFGASLGVAKAFTLLLTWAAIPLTYSLSRRIFSSEPAALVAAGVVAFHPHFIAYSSILASEPLFTCLTLAFFNGSLAARQKPIFAGPGGAALGLACLVRPQAILLPLMMAAFSWKLDAKRRRDAFLVLGLTFILAGAVMSPWLLHTKAVFGRFVFVSTNGGDNLLIGHHPGATGRYNNPDACGLVRPPGMKEGERDQAALKQGIANIKSDPFRSLALIPAKVGTTLFTTTDAAYWAFQKNRDGLDVPGKGSDKALFLGFRSLSHWAFIGVLAAGLIGLAKLLFMTKADEMRMAGAALVFSGVLLPLLLSAVFFGNPRFFFAAIPLLAIAIGGIFASSGKASLTPDQETSDSV